MAARKPPATPSEPTPAASQHGQKKTRAGSSGSSSKDAAASAEPSAEAPASDSSGFRWHNPFEASPEATRARRKRPRPTYSPAVADEICARLAGGESLIAICRDEHLPAERTVRGWVVDDYEGFAPKYARARDIGLERMAEETVEIADDSGLDVVMTEDGPRADGEVVQRAKLRVDTRKWLLSKLAPKRYGDRLQVDATVSVEAMDNRELVSTLQELATRLGVVLPDWITAIAKQEGTGE